MILHVLIVPVSWVACCWCSSFQLRVGAPACAPGLAFCLMDHWTCAWICNPQLRCDPRKNGMDGTCCCNTRGHMSNIGDHQPYTTPTKGFRCKCGISGGWCTNCQHNIHHPQDCKDNVQHGSCGGGAWTLGSEIYTPDRLLI